MLTTTNRKYIKKAVQIQSARSYSTMAKLDYALRGHGLQFAKHIVMQNGDRFIPIFEGLSMPKQDREIADHFGFRVV